jgi:VCBS repeat-containing protein
MNNGAYRKVAPRLKTVWFAGSTIKGEYSPEHSGGKKMKATTCFVAVLMLLAAATGALAGESKKCDGAPEDCIAKIKEKAKSKGWLGVELKKNDKKHAVVASVVADSPAAQSGFQEGDIIVAVDGVDYYSDDKKDQKMIKKAWAPDSEVTFTVKRDGAKQELAVTLTSMPKDVVKTWIKKHLKGHHPDYKG